MKKTKEQKGITLIALVITIIILLILAGIVISQLTNSNIFNRAQVAVDEYNRKAGQADVVIGQLEELLSQYSGENSGGGSTPTPTPTPATPLQPTAVVATSGAEITYDANGGTGNINDGFTAPLGNGFKGWNTAADGSGTMYLPGDEVSTSTTLYAIWGGTYKLGEEVTIGTETFYVIIDEGTSATNVTLLAKYNLDKNANGTTGKYYQKPNVDYSETACAFSSTMYWGDSEWEENFDLNEYTTAAVASANSQTAANNAIMRARDYATSTINSSATGRLLTSTEADILKDINSDLTYGKANQRGSGSSEYGLLYWLSNAYESDGPYIYMASGSKNQIDVYWDWYDEENYSYATYTGYKCSIGFGVRPVVTVAKSLIQQ